jgi:pyruvate/2-oxoglutarate dehydrogenase complex dihydrolipoamide dehydrogenase (E3) component
MSESKIESWGSVEATAPVPQHEEAGVWPLDAHNAKLLDNVCPRSWQNPDRPDDFVYDLVAIGAGAGGLVSAKQSARRGAKSALIERHLAGGDCLNVGCVPSKALLRCSRAVAEQNREDLGLAPLDASARQVSFAKVMERMRRLRAQIAPVDSYEATVNAGADMYFGNAVFKGPHEIEVSGKILRFRKAVIASGGRAMVVPIPGLKESPYMTNASLFNLEVLPPRMVVLGAGPIGCEMAQAFSRFGSKVTVIDILPQAMGPEDPEAARVVKEALEADGVRFLLNAKTSKVDHTPAGDGKSWPRIALHVSVGENSEEVECDVLLVATGRVPNVEGLCLEAANVKYDRSGVHIDDELKTSNPDILAIGDCCNRPEMRFTHMSGTMAGMAVQNALFSEHNALPVNAPSSKLTEIVVPRCTYTEPEVASAGLNAATAEKKGVLIDQFKFNLDDNDRCILEGSHPGCFVKIFCKKGTEEIVGSVVVAERAGEVLGEILVAMQHGIGLSKLGRTVHPYPTMGEGVQQCGLQYNRAKWQKLG